MDRGNAARAGPIMPLDKYGVLLGAKAGYHRDRPDNFGRFYHGHIDVQAPGQLYKAAF